MNDWTLSEEGPVWAEASSESLVSNPKRVPGGARISTVAYRCLPLYRVDVETGIGILLRNLGEFNKANTHGKSRYPDQEILEEG
jgi:hypothetical protein